MNFQSTHIALLKKWEKNTPRALNIWTLLNANTSENLVYYFKRNVYNL